MSFYTLGPSRPAGQDLSFDQELEVMCECGHPVKSHSYMPNSNLSNFHVEWVGQCFHPDCNITEEIPQTDRRRKKQYRHINLCSQFRKT